ncbi:MAG TPA: cupin domain-containing protein [Nitrospiraceae bacterium]
MGISAKETGKRKFQETEQAAKTVGARLRQIRQDQDITLVELAKTAGIDIATISRIETGKMTGTIESHMRLANALGVKLTDLYSGIEEARVKEGVSVQPAGQRTDVYVHEAGKSSVAILTKDVLKKKLMPVLVTIEPGGSTAEEEAKVGTEKFLFVLDGQLEIHVGKEKYTLRRGANIYFDAAIPHQLHNSSHRICKCLVIITPPVL